jgi:4-amino-4-deoxy-L-arabinose transferase-like glycosyltransferase
MGENQRRPILLGVIWLAFLIRGFFYCLEQPMWEGFDEWAHFAYIEHIAERGALPSRTDQVPIQVKRSLNIVPLSPSIAASVPGSVTHDMFWLLSSDDRQRREENLQRSSPASSDPGFSATQYEAQHPPLYYLAMAPLYLVVEHRSLPAKLLVLRALSVVLASTVVFLGYGIARCVLGSTAPALLVAIMLAALPGLSIDVCRVGNESLSIALISAAVFTCLRACRRESRVLDWLLFGALMGAALLTKAYALALLPLFAVATTIRILRDRQKWKDTVAFLAASLATALAIAGWWYWCVWTTTGTLSGEQMEIFSARFTIAQKLSAALRMNWRTVADAAVFSHIWVGGWSFLLVRSWMYRICEFIGMLGVTGLLIYAIRRVSGIGRKHDLAEFEKPSVLVTACSLMALALAYDSILIFLVKNITTAIGWYFLAVAAPEFVLLSLGLSELLGEKRSLMVLATVCVFVAVLDLYTVHFLLMPYYTGMISHRPSGGLEAFHFQALVRQLSTMLARLSVNRPVGFATLTTMWAAYLCSTVGLIGIAVHVASTWRSLKNSEVGTDEPSISFKRR